MANPSKDKGTRFETAVVDYLREHGFPNAERRAQQGANDCGDIAGVPDWVLELKATNALDLAGALTEAEKERTNAGVRHSAAIIKRRQKSTADAYVALTLGQFVAVIADLEAWREGAEADAPSSLEAGQ